MSVFLFFSLFAPPLPPILGDSPTLVTLLDTENVLNSVPSEYFPSKYKDGYIRHYYIKLGPV